MLLLYAVLVCFINSALSGIITTPGPQRKLRGETVTFQWSVTETLSNYSVYNSQSGTLNANANYTFDGKNGVVTLTIRSIDLTDAGNYSLSVTIGTATQTDASALLFVYGPPITSVSQTSYGITQLPSKDGDTVELACTVISTSLPEAYRPKKIYYKWELNWAGILQNISTGIARTLYYEDLIPGYNINDDGKTLVIESAQYRDTQQIFCYGQEQWSPYGASSDPFLLPLNYRPYIYDRNPASNKFNTAVGNSVSLSFSVHAQPAYYSATNWRFINTTGYEQDLPFLQTNSHDLTFTLTSDAYYGNYSITLSNPIGRTTETFQVLPPGPPDAPSSVKALFVSSDLIVIEFNCMWNNGREQTTVLQLKTPFNDSVIDSSSVYIRSDCYDSIETVQFRNGIQPETDYEVLVWSKNNLGSSDIIKLPVKTPQTFKFFVSPKAISLNGNQAIVNFSSNVGKIKYLIVTCCLDLTGDCVDNYYYNLNGTVSQITVYGLPPGDVYIFDFNLRAIFQNRRYVTSYYVTKVNGLRVSRNEDSGASTFADGPTTVSTADGGKTTATVLCGAQANYPLTLVIVLGGLLRVAGLALIG